MNFCCIIDLKIDISRSDIIESKSKVDISLKVTITGALTIIPATTLLCAFILNFPYIFVNENNTVPIVEIKNQVKMNHESRINAQRPREPQPPPPPVPVTCSFWTYLNFNYSTINAQNASLRSLFERFECVCEL